MIMSETKHVSLWVSPTQEGLKESSLSVDFIRYDMSGNVLI